MDKTTEPEKVTREEVKHDVLVIHEFIAYLRQLALEDADMPLTAGQVWKLYTEGVRVGRLWEEVAEDLKLPEPDPFFW